MSFTDQQLTKWANDYEREICSRDNLIADRWSIAIINGQSEYELPNYVSNIRAVLYKGKEVHPKGFRASIMTGDVPLTPMGSIPYEYIVTGMGLRVIKFRPTPMEDINEYSGDLFTIAADRVSVIVEFYRTPSTTDYKLQLPPWIRRYILKDYVCWKAFGNEGPAQDIRGATYYSSRLGVNDMYISEIKKNMNQGIILLLNAEHKFNRRQRPAHPILPSNFGYPTTY
jgi:hypothetical protein